MLRFIDTITYFSDLEEHAAEDLKALELVALPFDVRKGWPVGLANFKNASYA